MIEDTIKRIEDRLRESGLEQSEKGKLAELLADLRDELARMPQEKSEEAGTVASFTEVAASQALRRNSNKQLLDHASEGMVKSLEGMEQEFPGLTRVVGQICNFLSSMGI